MSHDEVTSTGAPIVQLQNPQADQGKNERPQASESTHERNLPPAIYAQ
jgi:hypothetical protein